MQLHVEYAKRLLGAQPRAPGAQPPRTRSGSNISRAAQRGRGVLRLHRLGYGSARLVPRWRSEFSAAGQKPTTSRCALRATSPSALTVRRRRQTERSAKRASPGPAVICVDGAYHGHTGHLIDISPYKFGGPGGAGRKPHVHVAESPDTFRGRFRSKAIASLGPCPQARPQVAGRGRAVRPGRAALLRGGCRARRAGRVHLRVDPGLRRTGTRVAVADGRASEASAGDRWCCRPATCAPPSSTSARPGL